MRLKFISEKKRRYLYCSNESKSNRFKSQYKNKRLPISNRVLAMAINSNKISRISHLSRVRNRCIITGRSRSILRKYKISRIIFRDFALKGFLSGIRRSVW